MFKESERKEISHYALIAKDTSYSLSPFIHNFSSRLLSNKAHYAAKSLQEENLKNFLDLFSQKGGLGLNVSNPFKKSVLSFCDSTHLFSGNTLKYESRRWKAYSTDGEGFWKALERYDSKLYEVEAFCFLGSGDVTPSLLEFMKNKLEGKPVYFIRRSEKNDKILFSLYSKSFFLPFEPTSLKNVIKKFDGKKLCLIQATSAPSQGNDLSLFLPVVKNFRGLFCDLIYSTPSALFYYFKSKGVLCLDGLPMLIEQALLSQNIWWGKSASYEEIYKALEEKLGRKSL